VPVAGLFVAPGAGVFALEPLELAEPCVVLVSKNVVPFTLPAAPLVPVALGEARSMHPTTVTLFAELALLF
jgi:hypothetical protein